LPLPLAEPRWRPPVDLYETSRATIVKTELAGMTEEDFQIALYDDVLVVEGTRPWEPGEEETHFHAVEVRYGYFRLQVPLTVAVDADRVEAHYDRGFLYVTLPKAEGPAL
jgi:HSP20 family molecular chaperone IbpA